jgi:hypothetical protein
MTWLIMALWAGFHASALRVLLGSHVLSVDVFEPVLCNGPEGVDTTALM